MASIYDINFPLVIERLLPPSKRNTIILSYLGAIVKPLQEKHDEIFVTSGTTLSYRDDVIERTKYNSQTMVLEAILNKVFSITGTSLVYITNNQSNFINETYLYNQSELNNSLYLYNEGESGATINYLYNQNEFLPDFDFTVNIPIYYSGITQQIIGETNLYKISGVNFNTAFY